MSLYLLLTATLAIFRAIVWPNPVILLSYGRPSHLHLRHRDNICIIGYVMVMTSLRRRLQGTVLLLLATTASYWLAAFYFYCYLL